MAFKLLALSVLVATLAIGANGEGLNIFGLLGANGIIGGLLGSGLGEGLLGDNGLVGGLLGQNGLVGGLLNTVISLLNNLLGGEYGILSKEGFLFNLITDNGLVAILGEQGLFGILMAIANAVTALLTTIGKILASKEKLGDGVEDILQTVSNLLKEVLIDDLVHLLDRVVGLVPNLLDGLTGTSGVPSVASTGAF